tara:strand:+ start:286 stop:1494 length:1209 start_codon:yes stop_codon:yes gene_type:complete
MSWIKSMMIVLSTTAVAILAFDVAAYFFIPRSMIPINSYGQLIRPNANFLTSNPILRLKDYYITDDVNGFDLAANAKAQPHVFSDSTITVFTNDLSCWDLNNRADFLSSDNYTYFAGDSFTWGHAEYDYIFPRVYEKLSNELVAKCGVPHTGQLHQFQKFKEFIKTVNKTPEKVFIGFFINDPSNDYSHPHSDVYRGVRYDHKWVSAKGDIVKKNVQSIKDEIDFQLENNLNEIEQKPFIWPSAELQKIKAIVKAYSLSANLVNIAIKNISINNMNLTVNKESIYNVDYFVDLGNNYQDNFYTIKNRTVLKQWKLHSVKNNYKLTIILIPPANKFRKKNYFESLKGFLDQEHIAYLDLHQSFTTNATTFNRMLYWPLDGHLNEYGNMVLGETVFAHEQKKRR